MSLPYIGSAPKKYLPGTYFDSYLAVSNVLAGVTRDAASGKYFPASGSEWNTVFAAAGLGVTFAGNIWLCQEASGNLADSSGAGLTLVAAGTPSYQQAVTGYTRLKVSNPTDGAGARFTATGTDIATNSNALFGVFDMPTANPAGARSMLELGTVGTRAALEINNTPLLIGRSGANTATDATDFKNAVRPLVLDVNRTGNSVLALSDQAKLTPTFDGTMAGTLIDLWSVATGNQAAICGTLYLTRFTGTAAELTAAQWKTLLQTLGWSIPWT